MSRFFRRFIKFSFCLVAVLSATNAGAQVSLIQQTIDKIESYRNLSYRSVDKTKEFTSDTMIVEYKYIFSKAPEDKKFGYLFRMESFTRGNKFPVTTFYNGKEIVFVDPGDSSYTIKEKDSFVMGLSLLGRLNWIKEYLQKWPAKISAAGDTVIGAKSSRHLIVNTYDTLIGKEHCYTRIHVFIDKLSGMPDYIIYKSRSATFGNAITDYYSILSYTGYQYDREGVDLASMTAPRGFHEPEDRPAQVLLPSGMPAPDWTLYSSDGKKTSLSKMKGKVVMLDFFFIGCGGCMLSLKPLNRLHERFKDKNVVILSLTFRDNSKSAMEFKNNYHIKYPVYVGAGDAVRLYHVEGFPTYYFIDKKGKVAATIVGYSDEFEEKAASIVDNLLKD